MIARPLAILYFAQTKSVERRTVLVDKLAYAGRQVNPKNDGHSDAFVRATCLRGVRPTSEWMHQWALFAFRGGYDAQTVNTCSKRRVGFS